MHCVFHCWWRRWRVGLHHSAAVMMLCRRRRRLFVLEVCRHIMLLMRVIGWWCVIVRAGSGRSSDAAARKRVQVTAKSVRAPNTRSADCSSGSGQNSGEHARCRRRDALQKTGGRFGTGGCFWLLKRKCKVGSKIPGSGSVYKEKLFNIVGNPINSKRIDRSREISQDLSHYSKILLKFL